MKLKEITPEDSQRLVHKYHVWKQSDRFWKLSNKYYGDPGYWWVIARYNEQPTESHLDNGDTIVIPFPLQVTLRVMGYQDMAKKKKRQKKKPVKQMGKITTGLWEQAFIVASLPQFVDCRISEWDAVTGGTQHRIGEWIGINGDLSHIMGLLANAQDIEAMNHMSSAQISSLIPYMKLEKANQRSIGANSRLAQRPYRN